MTRTLAHFSGSLWLLFLLPALAPAQRLYPLKTSTDSLRIRVGVVQNRLALEWLDRDPAGKGRKGDFMTITDLRLDDADLVLDYAPDKVRKDFLLAVALGLRPDGSEETLDPSAAEVLEGEVPNGKRITLLDGTERSLEPGRTYTLYVRKSLLGPVACDKPRPVFSVGRQLPYYGAAVVGTACLGVAALHRSQSNTAYDDYARLWAAGAGGEEGSEAQRRYQESKDKQKSSIVWGLAGAGIWLADAALFTRHWLRVRDKQRIYDQFCGKKGPELGLSPMPPSGQGAASIGLVLRW